MTLDLQRLDAVLCSVLRQVPALRTICVPNHVGVAQRGLPSSATVLQILGVAGTSEAEALDFAARLFDLGREISLRVLAILPAVGGSLLTIVTHHIAAGGKVS